MPQPVDKNYTPNVSQTQTGDAKKGKGSPSYGDVKQGILLKGATAIYSQVLSTVKGKQRESIAQAKNSQAAATGGTPSSSNSSGASQQAASSYYQTEIQGLIALLQTLESSTTNPQDLAKIKQQISYLQSLNSTNPTPSQTAEVQKIVNDLSGYSADLTPSQQIKFLKQEIEFLKQLVSQSQSDASAILQEIVQLQMQLSPLQQDSSVLVQFQQLMAILSNGGKLSTEQLQEFLSDVTFLQQNYSSFPANLQKPVFKLLGMLSATNQYGTGKYLGDLLLYKWISEYQTSGGTPGGQAAFLQQKLQEFIAEGKKMPYQGKDGLYSQMLSQIETSMSTNPPVINITIEEISNVFLQSGSGNIRPFLDFINQYVTSAQTTVNQEIQAFTQAISTAQTNYSNIINGVNSLKSAMNSLFTQLTALVPLPEAFVIALLNVFMPGQEAYLQEMASILSYANYGSSVTNSILDQIVGFSSSQDDFGFNNWFKTNTTPSGDGTGNFTGQTADQVKAEIAAEIAAGIKDKTSDNAAIGKINSAIADIRQGELSGKFTPAQAKTLIDQLNNEKANFKQSVSNINSNISNLQNLTVTGTTGVKNFTITTKNGQSVTDALKAISTSEGLVVSGDPNNDGFGGLRTIATIASTNETSWSSQSQQAQMYLQLSMTTTQQEWSIVAECLSMLNRIYMQLAGAIYKG